MTISSTVSSLLIAENSARFPMAELNCFAHFGGGVARKLTSDFTYSNSSQQIVFEALPEQEYPQPKKFGTLPEQEARQLQKSTPLPNQEAHQFKKSDPLPVQE